MFHRSCWLLVALTPGNLLLAQTLTIPVSCEATDGASSGTIAGITKRARQQVLVAGGLLATAQGRALDQLWLRRDANTSEPLVGGTANLSVIMSTTSRLPEQADRVFSLNHGPNPRLVFNGSINVPASPTNVVGLWDLEQSLRIPFSSPLPYTSGNLCIEFDSGLGLQASSKWPVDFASDSISGSCVSLGAHCSAVSQLPASESLWTNAEQLTIGACSRFALLGRLGTPGFLVLGGEINAGGIDLSAVGMTGCRLYVHSVTGLPVSFAGRPANGGFWEIGAASVEIPIPFTPTLLSGTFAAQAVNLETGSQTSNPLGVTLSQGLRVTLASTIPTLGMALVDSPPIDPPAPLPTEGTVINNRAPVLKLLYH